MQKVVENEFHKFEIDSKYKQKLNNFKAEIQKLKKILRIIVITVVSYLGHIGIIWYEMN